MAKPAAAGYCGAGKRHWAVTVAPPDLITLISAIIANIRA